MRTTIEMAREAAGAASDWALFREFMPEIHKLAELVRADERARMAEQPAQQEPVAGCVCRWNSEGDRVVTCERHQGWLEVIAEWADRARDAEKKLKALNTSPPSQEEPVACRYGDNGYACCEGGPCAAEEYNDKTDWQERGMVAEAALAKLLDEKGEPVAVVSGYYGGQCVILPIDPARIFNSNTALYTSPPQRTWVGLSEQEAAECWSTSTVRTWQAIEAKLKEKNNG